MKYDQEGRSLELICLEEGGFAKEVYGNIYCSIGLTKQIDCQHQSKYTDHNDCYTCTNTLYSDDNEHKDA